MRTIALAAGLLGGAVSIASAQSVPPRFADDVLVTATLVEEPQRDLPVSATVISPDEIEARQATEVEELLRTVPGLSVARSGSPGHLTSLFTRGTNSDHTLVLWNGVILNDPFFGGYDWAHLPTHGIERVEVVRGPFSALYGSDALGGVVQVLSGPGEEAEARLEAGGDGYGRVSVSGGWSGEGLSLGASGHLREGDGVLANDFYDAAELLASADWTPRPGATLGLVARVHESEIGIPLNDLREPSPLRRQRLESREVAVPFRADVSRFGVEALLSHTEADLAFRDPEDPFLFTRSDTDAERLRARAAMTFHPGNDLWVAGGAEWERQQVHRTSSFGVDLEDERRENWALFGQLHRSFDRWEVDLGIRRDEDQFFGAELSPKAGVVVRLGAGWRITASYGHAFRSPSIGELFFPFFGNPDLEPEESDSYELGWVLERGGWTARVVAFHNRIENLIDPHPVTFQAVNVGHARTRGVELGAGLRRGDLSVDLNATLLDAEDRDSGLPLLRRPDESANLVLAHRPGRWTWSVTARFVGDRPDLDPVTLGRVPNPSYSVVDVAAQLQLTSALAPYARLENATDEAYDEALGFPAPGVTLVGGVSLRF